jgi:hypothetical protein
MLGEDRDGRRLNDAEEAIPGRIGHIRSTIKEQFLGLAIVLLVVGKDKVPQAGDRDRRSVRMLELTEISSRGRIEGVDVAVSLDVADQDVVAEPAEIGWRLNDSPRVPKQSDLHGAAS